MSLRNQYVTINGGAGEDMTWTVEEVLKSSTADEFAIRYLEDMGTYPYIHDVGQRERTFKLVWEAANSQVIADVTAPVQIDTLVEVVETTKKESKKAKPNTDEGSE